MLEVKENTKNKEKNENTVSAENNKIKEIAENAETPEPTKGTHPQELAAKNVSLETIVVNTIMDLGISPSTKGYHYLKDGIMLCLATDDKMPTNKQIYTQLAEMYSSSESAVERAIRHAVKSGWPRHSDNLAYMIFKHTLQSKFDVPTNSVFFTTVSEWIRVYRNSNL